MLRKTMSFLPPKINLKKYKFFKTAMPLTLHDKLYVGAYSDTIKKGLGRGLGPWGMGI